MPEDAQKVWTILVEPQGRNENGANTGGMVVQLARVGGGQVEEVGRVAFERANSLNPDTDFADALEAEVDKARKAVDTIHELLAGAGELR